MNPYQILGVKPTDSTDIFTAAYRLLAKRYHPDVQATGDAVKFLEIKRAYDVLMNPDLRKQFDASGEMPDGETAIIRAQAKEFLLSLFQQMILDSDAHAIEGGDIIGTLRSNIEAHIGKFALQADELTAKAHAVGKALAIIKKRMRKKKEKAEDTIFSESLEEGIRQFTTAHDHIQQRIKVAHSALALLKEYQYDFDKGVRPTFFTVTMTTNSTTAGRF